jgi:cytochrome c oxidase subunit III
VSEAASLPLPAEESRSKALAWLSTVDHKQISILYMLLALVFLLAGGLEAMLLRAQLKVTLSQSLFGITFFPLTGFHGLHVAVGIAALAVMFVVSGTRGLQTVALQAVALYRQFVDLAWIAIYSVVYLGTLL